MSGFPLVFEDVILNGAGATLSLALPANQTTSIVGDGASGINRLGRLALGLTRPTSGRLTLLETDLSTLSGPDLLAYRRQVGYLPAGDGLLQNLSIQDNIALPLRFGSDMSESAIDGRLRIILVAAGLSDFGHLRPAQASDELRRRAALARALAFDPGLVILEEPFVGMTDRVSRGLLETARGGEVSGGSRRTVLTIGPNLPDSVIRRFEQRYRLIAGELRKET